jgi:hypothetical protein
MSATHRIEKTWADRLARVLPFTEGKARLGGISRSSHT